MINLFLQAWRAAGYHAAKEVYDDPSVLENGWFWVLVILIGLAALYYYKKNNG